MAAGLKIREAFEADRDAVADIWHASASLPGVGPAEMPTRDELRGRLDLELAGGWQVTVALDAGAILGFVAFTPDRKELNELFIRLDALGKGIGKALLAHAKQAMPQGFSLYTRSANLRARRFYEKAGFAVLREDVHPRSGDPIVYYGWSGC